MAKLPNVVLITIDSLRRDCLGCYGYPLPISPNIDEVAQRGAVFENAYSVGLGSIPTRASMLTGLLPFSHGIVDWRRQGDGLARQFDLIGHRSLPTVLGTQGYQTFAIDFLGEWHRAAFDYYSGMLRRRTDVVKLLAYGAVTGYRLLQKALPYAAFKRVLGPAPKENIAERVVSDVLSRLDGMGEPFFLFMHFHDTHTPYDPPIQYSRAFDGVSTEYNQSIDAFLGSMKDSFLRTFMTRWTYGADYTDEIVRRYLGSIRYLDEQIGRVLSALTSSGFLDSTLLAITADHGEAMGEHGDYFTHSTIYNEIARVPLIVRFPGGNGKRVEAPCQLTDIMPTILDFLGIETGLAFDGSSLLSLLEAEGEHGPRDRDIFLAQPVISTCRPARVGIIRGRHKYIGCPDQSPQCHLCGLVHHQEAELYDLETDPGEMNNVAETEKHKREELKAALSGFRW